MVGRLILAVFLLLVACERKPAPTPIPSLKLCNPEKGNLRADNTLRRACPAGKNDEKPNVCVLSDEDRQDLKFRTLVVISRASESFRTAALELAKTLSGSDSLVLDKVEYLAALEYDRMGLGMLELNDGELTGLAETLSRGGDYEEVVRGAMSDYVAAAKRGAECFDFDIGDRAN